MDEELKEYLDSMRAELRHQIGLVAEGVIGANQRIDRLDAKVEHLGSRVEHLGTKIEYLDTKVTHLAAEMKNELADVRSLIKFTYTDLDQRVRRLEQR